MPMSLLLSYKLNPLKPTIPTLNMLSMAFKLVENNISPVFNELETTYHGFHLQHRGHNNHLIHIMQPEHIYSRTHIFQQKQWKEFITNTNNLLMYWSKFQAQITTSNRKEKNQQSHTHTFKIKASIQKSRASSIRSTHILHYKIFAYFPRKLHA